MGPSCMVTRPRTSGKPRRGGEAALDDPRCPKDRDRRSRQIPRRHDRHPERKLRSWAAGSTTPLFSRAFVARPWRRPSEWCLDRGGSGARGTSAGTMHRETPQRWRTRSGGGKYVKIAGSIPTGNLVPLTTGVDAGRKKVAAASREDGSAAEKRMEGPNYPRRKRSCSAYAASDIFSANRSSSF